MLTSPRTVHEISPSSVLAEQGHLIAFPHRPLKKSNAESPALRNIWRAPTCFGLGLLISSLWVCLRCKSRPAARIGGLVVILSALPGFAWAACPPVPVTAGTVTLVGGESCPDGLQAGTDGIIVVPSGAIVTLPGPVVGAIATSNGTITFDGPSTISTSTPTRSLFADGVNSLINGTARPTITATGLIGDDNAAVYAKNGGQIILTNGFAATGTGINASTVTADGVGSFVDATHGSQITMNVDPTGMNNSEAVQMLRGGLVKLDASTVLRAVGIDVAGLKIDGTTVPFGTMDGLTVNIVGDPTSTEDALGVWATNQVSRVGSDVNVDRLTVTGDSPRSLGLFTIASTINATNSNITVNGAGGIGAAAALNGGTINLSNSTLTLNGPGAGAVRARNQFGEGATNIFTASGGSITSLQAPAFIAQGGLLDATLSNGVQVTGNGRLVSAVTGPTDTNPVAPSTINLVGTTGAILNGDAFADADNIINISLASGAKWNGAALNVTSVDVGADSTWSMPANSTVTQAVKNAGLIQLGNRATFTTLTTQNYLGLGGTLGLNTYLGPDGSPSDRLVISGGSATGNTIVHVTNAGGPGEQTTGDGIQVVSAIGAATTSASAFALPAGELRAGAYDYDLFRGGAGGSRPYDWFLRSDFVVPLVPIGPSLPTNPSLPLVPISPSLPSIPPVTVLPPPPPPDPLPPGVAFPIIGPELATYGVVQPLARQLGLSILGTLDDRRGDTYEPDGCGVAAAAETSTVDLPTR
jgi:type V secretory pathway adhesin AidA